MKRELFPFQKEFVNKIYVLIPAYNPDEKLNNLINELTIKGISEENIVVVNDGSNNGYDFSTLHVKVLSHNKNLGKGEALKNGFGFIIKNYKDCSGVVTADCDYQHLPDDIVNIAKILSENPNKLIFGSRIFKHEEIPFKSLFGNKFVSGLMKIFYGLNIRDTQTGLRGIPEHFLENFINIEASGFSYEMEMLINAVKNGIEIEEIGIETVYIDKNSGSNFKPLKDSYKILKTIIKEKNNA